MVGKIYPDPLPGGPTKPKPTKTKPQDLTIGPVAIGPNGRDPRLALPRIRHFLIDEDSYRDPTWQYRLEEVSKYVEEANEARCRGDLGYDDPYVTALLEDVRILIHVHRGFDKWKNAPSRWITDIIPTPNTSTRLPPLPDEQIPRPPYKKRNRRKWVDLGADAPARSAVFSRLSSTNERAEVDQYHIDEELYFERVRDPGVEIIHSGGFNRFWAEKERFESCIEDGIGHTYSTLPPKPAKDAANEAFYEARGWQRAALQQCLNMFTNHENRVINTPWRRAVLPFKEPVPMPKEIVYYARALDPERVTKELRDPFPWVYWQSQFAQLQDTMAQWERRRYNLDNWHDFRRSALPMNYKGPYVYEGYSVYDDHWLKMGAYLRRLRAYMIDAVGRAPRSLMVAILKDIEVGSNWDPDKELSREDERRDIMRRGEIDQLSSSTDVPLIDEADAAWLRFLCEPSSTLEIWSSQHQSEDNLSILFQTRLEEFFNDMIAFPVPEAPDARVGSQEFFDWLKDCETGSFASVEDALSYINVGPNGGESHGNDLYQFTMNEAQDHIVRLGELGRCLFVVGDNGVVTHLMRPPYQLHPEHRIRWRYEDKADYINQQRLYREGVIEHLMNENYLLYQNKDSTLEEFEGILEHRGGLDSRRLAHRLRLAQQHPDQVVRLSQSLLRLLIQPEIRYVQGSYPDSSVEKQRQSPSWSDLMDWPAVAEAAAPTLAEKAFEVPERTVQFFRNLAYRMGRTLAHVKTIERRLQYTVPPTAGETAKTALWQPISQDAFLDGMRHWQNSIEAGASEIELKPPTTADVIENADPDGLMAYEIKKRPQTGHFRMEPSEGDIIREGIIKDCVMNRNTLYPGRHMEFEDSSGYYKDTNDFRAHKLFQGQTRPSLFKWATDAQRRYQAPYTREAFFSMQRWPLFHQSAERQDIIRRRADEIPRLDPGLPGQRYGILQPRLAGGAAGGTKAANYAYGATDAYGTKGGLGTKGPSGTNGTRDPTSTKPPGTPGAGGAGYGYGYSYTPTPSSTNPSTSNNMSTATAGGSKPPAGPPAAPTAPTGKSFGDASGKPPVTRQLVPFEKQKETFFPGPAIFPMAESLLQQISLSQTLSQLIYPQPEPKWYEKVVNLYNTCVKWPESHVTTLPPITASEIPRSNPRKRKIPAEFILRNTLRPDRPMKQPRRTHPVTQTQAGGELADVPQVNIKDENTPWQGYPNAETTLYGALSAIATSLEEQSPGVPHPNIEQLAAASKVDTDDESDWSTTMSIANATLQEVTGPGKQFSQRSYRLAVAVTKGTDVRYFVIPPSEHPNPPNSKRHMIWIYVVDDATPRYGAIMTNRDKINALKQKAPPITKFTAL
ncbi:hypothetical protein GGR53DRAFT_526676 [Hypoxylon sp. FL1150]|nr:hypothetical protein GGR53DRAFT_526676 [Hypoxylon sp. FL1150]